MHQLPFQDDGCSDAVAVCESASVITEDDADKTCALRRSAGEITGDGHAKILFHCSEDVRRHQYWIDNFVDQLAIQSGHSAHLMNDVERPLRAVLIKPVSDNVKPTSGSFDNEVSLPPKPSPDRRCMRREPLWKMVAMVAKYQACHSRRTVESADEKPYNFVIWDQQFRSLYHYGQTIECDIT
jgi:hypothetical protein